MENDSVTVSVENSTALRDPSSKMATDDNTAITDVESETSSTSTLVAQENVETTDMFVLRFSRACRPYRLPTYPEIAFEAVNQFDDPFLNVIPRKEGSEEVYKI